MLPNRGGSRRHLLKGALLGVFLLGVVLAGCAPTSVLAAVAASSENPPAAAPSNAGNDTSAPKPDATPKDAVDKAATTKDNTTVSQNGKPTDTGCTKNADASAACLAAGPGKLTYRPEGCNSDSCQVTCDKDACKPEQIASAASSGGTFTPAGTNAPVSFPPSTPSSQQSTPDAQLSGAITGAFNNSPAALAQANVDLGHLSAGNSIAEAAGIQTPAPSVSTPSGAVTSGAIMLAAYPNLASEYNMVPSTAPTTNAASQNVGGQGSSNSFGSGGTPASNQGASQSECQGFCNVGRTFASMYNSISSGLGNLFGISAAAAPSPDTTQSGNTAIASPPYLSQTIAIDETLPGITAGQSSVEGESAPTEQPTALAQNQPLTMAAPPAYTPPSPQVDAVVQQAFAQKQNDALTSQQYAQGLLATCQDAAQCGIAQALVDSANQRLTAINNNYKLYSAGTPSPALQDAIVQVQQSGATIGTIASGLSSISNGASNLASSIGYYLDQTDPSRTSPSSWLNSAAQGILSVTGSVIGSAANLGTSYSVPGFANPYVALGNAIDPVGTSINTATDIVSLAPIGYGVGKLLFDGLSAGTAIDATVVARNAGTVGSDLAIPELSATKPAEPFTSTGPEFLGSNIVPGQQSAISSAFQSLTARDWISGETITTGIVCAWIGCLDFQWPQTPAQNSGGSQSAGDTGGGGLNGSGSNGTAIQQVPVQVGRAPSEANPLGINVPGTQTTPAPPPPESTTQVAGTGPLQGTPEATGSTPPQATQATQPTQTQPTPPTPTPPKEPQPVIPPIPTPPTPPPTPTPQPVPAPPTGTTPSPDVYVPVPEAPKDTPPPSTPLPQPQIAQTLPTPTAPTVTLTPPAAAPNLPPVPSPLPFVTMAPNTPNAPETTQGSPEGTGSTPAQGTAAGNGTGAPPGTPNGSGTTVSPGTPNGAVAASSPGQEASGGNTPGSSAPGAPGQGQCTGPNCSGSGNGNGLNFARLWSWDGYWAIDSATLGSYPPTTNTSLFVIAVNGQNVKGMSDQQVANLINGSQGSGDTSVTLSLRTLNGTPFNVTVQRSSVYQTPWWVNRR